MGLVARDDGLQRHKSVLVKDMSSTRAAGIALHDPHAIQKCERKTPQNGRAAGAAERYALTPGWRRPEHTLPHSHASSFMLNNLWQSRAAESPS
jgi:hypothetical protein